MSFRVSTALFKVEIDGIDCSEISEVSGFDVFSPDSQKSRSNYNNTFTTELRIRRSFMDLEFFQWLNDNKYGQETIKKNGKLSFITPDNEEIISFKLEDIFPLEWHGPALRKSDTWSGSELVYEEVILAVEKITKA